MINSRIVALKSLMKEQKIPAMLISKDENVRYLSGFKGDSAVLIITDAEQILITDGRYTEQAKTEAPNFKLIQQIDGLWKKTAEVILSLKTKRMGFEGHNLTYSVYLALSKLLPNIELCHISLENFREVKDEEEISNIKKACNIADLAFDEVLKFLRPGVKEYEIAAFLENAMKLNGSEKAAFDTIAVSGVRGSLPHGVPTEKLIILGEFVTMDFGAKYNGYASDITRTVAVGNATDEMRRAYSAVLKAQETVLPYIKPDISGVDADKIAREALGEYEKYFAHGLGHGVGLEIHEEPRLSKKSKCKALKENMIVTDEPGVYIEGKFGIRIEDTVLVTENGGLPLTKSDKRLIEL